MSSSSSSSFSYEVFLSFRGEDTRHKFTDHLYAKLDERGIRTFRDSERLAKGEEIAARLLEAIEGSRHFLVVLSDLYATSRWCLDELVKIMEQRREKGRIVFPIFYHVDPSDVRRQGGSYGKALAGHEERNTDRRKIQAWRAALTEVGNLSGWHLNDGRSEASLVEEITDTLLGKLGHVKKNLSVSAHQDANEAWRAIATEHAKAQQYANDAYQAIAAEHAKAHQQAIERQNDIAAQHAAAKHR